MSMLLQFKYSFNLNNKQYIDTNYLMNENIDKLRKNFKSIQTIGKNGRFFINENKLGLFEKEDDYYWIVYIPKITINNNNNNDDDDDTSGIISKLLKNIHKTNNISAYRYIAKIYESILPNHLTPDVNETFFNIFKSNYKTLQNDIIIYPTLCKLGNLLNKKDWMYKKEKYSLLLTNKINNSFLINLENFIIKEYYNYIINNCIDYIEKNLEDVKIFKKLNDLIHKCKIENNPGYLYSPLTQELFKMINSKENYDKLNKIVFDTTNVISLEGSR